MFNSLGRQQDMKRTYIKHNVRVRAPDLLVLLRKYHASLIYFCCEGQP